MIIAAAAAAAKAGVITSATKSLSDGVAGIFGDTATDRRRKSLTDQLLSSALAGDNSALVQLAYNAYEQRRGEPGDARTPVDGRMSPRDTRDLAVRALRVYVQQRGGVPDSMARWATQLRAPIIPRTPTITQRVEGVLREGIAQGTAQVATQRVDDFASRYGAWLAIGGVGVGAFILYRLARK